MRNEQQMMKSIMDYVVGNENVRTAILTSSRVNKDADTDFLSDYDVELYVSDLESFKDGDEWLEIFGKVMVRWPYKPRSTWGDEKWITRLILFSDGVRIDFQICDYKHVIEERYTNGYKVLVDKDNMTLGLNEPTCDEFIIKKPTEEEYLALVNDFWWDAYYVPKYLWRDELPFAKYMLDNVLRYSFLHKIMNWHIGNQYNWSIETGALGKKYKKLVSPQLWKEFEDSYTAGGIDENWQGLYKVIDLFRKLAMNLGEELGYEYPKAVDEEVMGFIGQIKETQK